jgi:hypothetical protein
MGVHAYSNDCQVVDGVIKGKQEFSPIGALVGRAAPLAQFSANQQRLVQRMVVHSGDERIHRGCGHCRVALIQGIALPCRIIDVRVFYAALQTLKKFNDMSEMLPDAAAVVRR